MTLAERLELPAIAAESGRVISPALTEDRLLEASEVAGLLGVPERWVREHTRAGHVPHVKFGRYVRYDRADLLAWVESLKAGGGPTFRRHRPDVVS